MSNLNLFELSCGAQSYDWGKLGQSSAVARYAAASNPDFSVNEDQPYAELWMGTHPSVPSKNIASGETLRDLVTTHPELLGPAVSGAFGAGELPFLFKVLSIRKALSIQAHPDKALGAQLHAADPKNYPDDNHKPEMAIAVTAFEGFCGFRPLEQISALLESVPEFKEIIGDAEAKAFETAVAGQEHAAEGSPEDKANRKALQALFSKLMNASADRVEDTARRLVERAASQSETFAAGFAYFDELAEDNGVRRGTDLAHLITRLNTQFPNDIGLFCGGLLLNYVRLYPGEAMFLRAKDPHAYISGDIIECMAASDNVVRAGFTPKFKDVDNLVSMLTYSYNPVLEQKMKPLPFPRAHATNGSAEFILYDPPIAEFAVLEGKLEPTATAAVEGLAGPSILITTEGAGKISTQGTEITLHAGSVIFIAPGTPVDIEASERLVTYRAFVEVSPETKL